MKKKTRNIQGFETCIHFDNLTYYCTIPGKMRKCDGICVYINKEGPGKRKGKKTGPIGINPNRRQVYLDKYQLGNLPRERAVYVLFAGDGNRSKSSDELTCIYVGETKDLRDAIKTHYSEKETNSCLKHHLRSPGEIMMIYEIMPNSNKRSRLVTMVKLNKAMEPSCNAPR